ncbi:MULTISPECIES: hypothetical protein [unclassified Streptomyces]|uniref:hypothetical protein n=1 Tax=unclassified Streptomyces TaxID=2593676 RepID=UPI0033263A5E
MAVPRSPAGERGVVRGVPVPAVRQVGDYGDDFDHAVTVERAGPVVLTEHDAHRR